MVQTHPSSQTYRRDLGNGLVVRWSTRADQEQLATLYSHIFRENAEAPTNVNVVHYVDSCMSGQHPLISANDFAVVEDTNTNTIVASTNLLSHTWRYEDVEFTVGRPEVVASHPDYRHRGLIRSIFELIHARSAARGDLVQAITGIPYYYRIFGYEYAIELDGDRTVFTAHLPTLKEGEAEPYHLRRATTDDIPLLMELYNREEADQMIAAVIPEEYWRWNLGFVRPLQNAHWIAYMICNQQNEAIGYTLVYSHRWDTHISVISAALTAGHSYPAVLPSLMRGLAKQADDIVSFKAEAKHVDCITFLLAGHHPLYDALGSGYHTSKPHYAWYVRVPDLPAFIRHIRPVLERRLANSIMAGHDGEFRLNFYRDGLLLRFEKGQLREVEPWRAEVWGPKANVQMPPLTFTQVLFGYRSLEQIRHIMPDAYANDDASALLLSILFPTKPSRTMPLD